MTASLLRVRLLLLLVVAVAPRWWRDDDDRSQLLDDDDGYGSDAQFGEDDYDCFDDARDWEWGSDPSRGEPSSAAVRQTGRPLEHDVQEDEFTVACEAGLTEQQLAGEFGIHVQQVKRLKKTWNLQGVADTARCRMPSIEALEEMWEHEPTLTVLEVAHHAGVSARALRKHFKRIGFCPQRTASDDQVRAALLTIQSGGWCSNLGATFAMSRLNHQFGLVVGVRQLRRCLQEVNPLAHERRRAEAAQTRYIYCVAGPRSLYHCDAHEKLAKIWGFWFHLCIDGYSRFIIYLTVQPNKLSTTVGNLFVQACNQLGWASRVRWDRGTENVLAIQAQWDYWWNHALSYAENERRGSALTGRSVQNCRAEYIWAYVKKHISEHFRRKFKRMETQLNILDPGDSRDLFCLHAVFLAILQLALDDFRDMWNYHLIRGARTQQGHGGGVPADLFFRDPIRSASVCQADDDQYYAEPGSFGVDEPFKGDTGELEATEANVVDPLMGWPSLVRLRERFFAVYPFCSSDGVDDYLTFKLVSLELLEWLTHLEGGGSWASFVALASPWSQSDDLNLRMRLAHIAQ